MDAIENYYYKREFAKAINIIIEISDQTNKYFSDNEPWKLLTSNKELAHEVCTFSLNAFKLISVMLKPVLPKLSADIEKILNLSFQQWNDAKNALPENYKIQMFNQILSRVDAKNVANMIDTNTDDAKSIKTE